MILKFKIELIEFFTKFVRNYNNMNSNMKSISNIFSQMPSDINQIIGTFLDIDSRVCFSTVLKTNEDIYTKKINSDKFMLDVHVRYLTRKSREYSKYEDCSCQKCIYKKNRIVTIMYNYILKVRDETMFQNQKLVFNLHMNANRLLNELYNLNNQKSKDIVKELNTEEILIKAIEKTSQYII
jgi:hypothetical protein